MENPVIIFGAIGLGKVALEIFKSNEVIVYGFLDDDKKLHGQEIDDVQIMGSTEDEQFLKVLGTKCEAFIAVDDNRLKKSLVKMLNEDYKVMPVNAFHATSFISPTAVLGHGNLISAGAVVNTFAKVGNHCIVNTKAVIDYEAVLADFVQIGAGAIVGAGAKIGESAFVGAGVTIVSGITVGKNARIGAGSLVMQNVADGETVFGVPAQKVK
ncbi:MAG: acetyltransferase [Cytophagales bacterium]|nr:MAG: acetyltransferase [Cytophagales bacterium]